MAKTNDEATESVELTGWEKDVLIAGLNRILKDAIKIATAAEGMGMQDAKKGTDAYKARLEALKHKLL